MKKRQEQPPPKGLSLAARQRWKQLLGEFHIRDAAGLMILEAALRAFDRAEQARGVLDAEGVVTLDSRGRPKAHPAASVERDNRAAFLAALKQLNLDIEPLRDGPGRPPRSY
jgi:P27 family predicted phage terminase small subunit